MALFRRAPKGRHALGAAVTSIPSGPLQELVAVPVTAPPAAEAPAPPPEPSWHQPQAAEPHVMDSIAELIATGEAWSTEPAPPPTWREPVEVPAARAAAEEPVVPAPVVEPVVLAVPAAPAAPAAPVVLAAPEPAAPPAPAVPARTALENALADLLPQQPDGAVPMSPPLEAPLVPLAAAPRVQLGFRDGSSTALDPSSSSSRALQELAQSLTRRD